MCVWLTFRAIERQLSPIRCRLGTIGSSQWQRSHRIQLGLYHSKKDGLFRLFLNVIQLGKKEAETVGWNVCPDLIALAARTKLDCFLKLHVY